MDSGESAAVLRDRRRDLRVLTELGLHADGTDRQDIAARGVSILGHAKRYWIVQGDYLLPCVYKFCVDNKREQTSCNILPSPLLLLRARSILHLNDQLRRPLNTNAYVQYVSLPTGYIADMYETYTEHCVAAGWGRHIPDSNVSTSIVSREIVCVCMDRR